MPAWLNRVRAHVTGRPEDRAKARDAANARVDRRGGGRGGAARNALMVPPLGIGLRDATSSALQVARADAPFAPSTQVVLFDLLLVDLGRGHEPVATAQRLG